MKNRLLKYFLPCLLLVGLGAGLALYVDKKIEAQGTAPKLSLGSPLPENLFVELAKAINPAVVNISTTQLPRRPGPADPRFRQRDPFFDLFEQFFGPMNPNYAPRQSLGTGFIIREDGLILTNNHVIDKADVVKVSLTNKESYEAEVIGKDARTDIALIKIKAKNKLPVAALGSSENLQVGEWVAAFGNPFGHDHTMTKGIISALNREINEINRFPFIQTDASINPGNSGGPLVNTKGLVVGVNTAIDARAQGIGFAIPIDEVKSLLPELEKLGSIRRGFIGVFLVDIDEASAQSLNLKTTDGALITQVVNDGPADKAGLKPYDLVVKFNGKAIKSANDLSNAVADAKVGSQVKVEIIREGKNKTLTLKVAEHPEAQQTKPKPSIKSYKGQKAPFDLGFKVADYSRSMAEEFGLPKLSQPRPVVIEVEPGSVAGMAGLIPGDLILDVNKESVTKATDVLRKLKKDETNILRILRQDTVALIWLRPRK